VVEGTTLVDIPLVTVLYIFAGAHRKSDVGDQLDSLQNSGKINLKVLEVDLLRSEGHDVNSTEFWNSLCDRVRAREFKVIICTPPCNTHSRARHSNVHGPPPLRSKEYPFGYPWLFGKQREAVVLANSFIDKMFEICELAHSVGSAFLCEHPEDLGKLPDLCTPASIWALDRMRTLQETTGAKTGAFHQCPWGAETSKPTRMIGTLDLQDPSGVNWIYLGWPSFDWQGFYRGPLPRYCGHPRHPQLIRQNPSDGSFKTAAAAAYPPEMCLWLALMIVRFCCQPKGGESVLAPVIIEGPVSSVLASVFLEGPVSPELPLEEASSEEEEDGRKKPLLKDHLGGFGNPMQASWSGKSRPMHDGGGLCSPGRWLPKLRKKCEWDLTESVGASLLTLLRLDLTSSTAKTCLGLACGKFVDSPFSDSLLTKGRTILAEAVSKNSKFSVAELLVVQKNQPFYLHLIGEILRLSNDPDWRIYFDSPGENFTDGVSVGPGRKMPRTPSVFERKSKHRKYDQTEFFSDNLNYKSAAGPEMSAVLEKQFEEESLLGFMYKTKLALVKAEFSDVRVAAQGAIEKGDDSWRILHDASHNVMINHETTIRDQIRMPSAGDARVVMQESAAHDEGPHFTLQWDVSKAHRRFLHRKQDHGLLCCRSDGNEEDVWVNVVGTFGVTSASYWWARLSSGICRLVLRFFYRQWLMQLLFADDGRLQANGNNKFDNLILAIFLWCLVGTPLTWKKCRGGMACEWVGYWIDYARFEIGISESRACWLYRWGDRVVKEGLVQMRDFAEGLGRLGFTAGVLEFYRPFLAPLYSWSAAAPRNAVLKVPPMVRLTLSWIISELKIGRRVTLCKKPAKNLGILFKTDTKGEADHVVLGGYEYSPNKSTKESRWFSTKLTREQVPWVFEKGHSSRTIASTELLSTLIAVYLFVPLPEKDPPPTAGVMYCQGITDNQTNSFVVARLMTTTFPLAAVLMQLTCMLSVRNLWLHLNWVPRLQNVEADALTNSDFSLFNPDLRVEVVWEKIPLEVMGGLLAQGQEFLLELERLKSHKRASSVPQYKLRKRVKKPWAAEI
jgi:hypothetical protein